MSRLSNALDNDVKALSLLRDELQLHSSLLKADLKDRWNELESELDVLREHANRAKVAAGQSKVEIETAAQMLVDSLQKGYADLRNALKR